MRKNSIAVLALFVGCWSLGNAALEFDIRVPRVADFLNRVSNTTFGIIRGGVNLVGLAADRVINTFGRVEDRLRALLEEFRGVILRGIPELNIPVLDPLHVNRINFDVNQDAAKLKGKAENLTIKHISKFQVDKERFTDLGNFRFKLDLNLTFPYIKVTGNYKVDGKVGKNFIIYGDGPFWLNLIGLKLGTSTILKFTLPAKLRVESLSIDIKLAKLENYFSNLLNDKEVGDLVNKAISRMAPEALDILWPGIKPSVEEQIKKYINHILENATVVNFAKRLFNVIV
ncbi:uncharacterized protein LOC143191649 [Rhynchophorus ferrugineus]|uniref:Hemolymph juvenile hormone binding protein n=1 Tax=Rhynchophorus ferrugineus TaxID=354439 RepID=A0A834MEJ7_RHYFE|nr:hypothetical protein GWI33_007888 [Rhynchophorus ferrugineus]